MSMADRMSDEPVIALKKRLVPTRHHPEWHNTYWAMVRTKRRPYQYGIAMVQPHLGQVTDLEFFTTYREANRAWWRRWRSFYWRDDQPPQDRGSFWDAFVRRPFSDTQTTMAYDAKLSQVPLNQVLQDARTDLQRAYQEHRRINRQYLWRVWLPYGLVAVGVLQSIVWLHAAFPMAINTQDMMVPFCMAWGFGGLVSRMNQRRRILGAMVFESAVVGWIHYHDPQAPRSFTASVPFSPSRTCPHCASPLQHVTDTGSGTASYQCPHCVYRAPES